LGENQRQQTGGKKGKEIGKRIKRDGCVFVQGERGKRITEGGAAAQKKRERRSRAGAFRKKETRGKSSGGGITTGR